MKNPGINLLDWMLTLLAMKGECWLHLNQGCLFSAHCRLCVRVYLKDPSLSRVHGSVDRAIFPCMGTMPMQWMDGAAAGYILFLLLLVLKAVSLLLSHQLLLSLVIPSCQNDVTLSLGTDQVRVFISSVKVRFLGLWRFVFVKVSSKNNREPEIM